MCFEYTKQGDCLYNCYMKPLPSKISVSAKVSKRECAILQRLAWEAKRTGGRKLSYNAIIRALIRLVKTLAIDLNDVKDIEMLKRRFLEASFKP